MGDGSTSNTTVAILIAVSSIITALVTKIVEAISSYNKGQREQTKEDRKDSLSEWQAIANRQQIEINECRKDREAIHKELLDYKIKCAKLEARIEHLEDLIKIKHSSSDSHKPISDSEDE